MYTIVVFFHLKLFIVIDWLFFLGAVYERELGFFSCEDLTLRGKIFNGNYSVPNMNNSSKYSQDGSTVMRLFLLFSRISIGAAAARHFFFPA